MKNNWFYISLVFALAIGAIVVWDSPPQLFLPSPPPTDESQLIPYAVIEDTHSRHFGEDGKLSYEFSTVTLKHFRLDLSRIGSDDFTTLDAPHLKLYANDNTWFVTAEKGRLTDQGRTLKLNNGVKVWQEKKDGSIFELNTDELWIAPHNKVIHTNTKVVFKSPQGELEAVGMRVNLADKHIQLLNEVHGQHEPI